jgi:hypothetical protein
MGTAWNAVTSVNNIGKTKLNYKSTQHASKPKTESSTNRYFLLTRKSSDIYVQHVSWRVHHIGYHSKRANTCELSLEYLKGRTNARILKADSHSMSEDSIWASLECQCCFWIAGGLVSYFTMRLLALQLFKNSIDIQEKLTIEPPFIHWVWVSF